MAIGGIYGKGGIRPGTFTPKQTGTAAAAETKVREQAARQAQVPARVAPPAAAADENAVPVEAPPGTDAALWSVLTAEERRYFAKLSQMGPLTYGPRPTGAPPALVRGGRIDTTV